MQEEKSQINGLLKHNVCFRIVADELDPLEITAMLGITPSKAHRRGDPNTSITKKGKVIEFSPFSTGVWLVYSDAEEHADLDYHLKSLLSLLYPLKVKLIELSQRGYSMDVFCGVFTHEAPQPGFDISSDSLRRLGELNISIGMCIY